MFRRFRRGGGEHRCDLFAGRYGYDLELHKVRPNRRPLLEAGDIVRFHKLETAAQIGGDPATNVGQTLRALPSLLAEAAVDSSGILVSEMFDHHEQHNGPFRWLQETRADQRGLVRSSDFRGCFDFCKAAVTSGINSAAICACAAVVKWMRSKEKYSGGKTGSKTIGLMPRSRNRRSIAAILAARCSLVPKNLRSLPPGCKMTKWVPSGAEESMRCNIPAVVAATTPALMTYACRPLALRRASSRAGNALCPPTPHPHVLLAPTATIWTGSAAAGLHAIGRRTTANAPTNLRLMAIDSTPKAQCTSSNASPPSGPSMDSGPPLAASSTPSPRPNAPITSPPPATMRRDRIRL